MTPPWTALLAVTAGLLLGWLYFESLWLTTRRMMAARRPWLTWLASFALRMVLLLAGLGLMLAASWWHLTAAALGVVAARLAVVRRYRPQGAAQAPQGGA